MDTGQLIRTLAADNATRPKPVWLTLTWALLAAAPVSIFLFFWNFGFRPDIMIAIHNPFFDLKFVITISVATFAVIVSLHLARPEASARDRMWLLSIPVGILAAGIAGESMLPQSVPAIVRLIGSNSRICLTVIPLLSLPLLVAALLGLRHGASSRPALTGAVAGLLSSSLAATLYASNCTDDSPLFVATWYPIAMLGVVLLGALAGSRLLRY